MNWTWQKVNYGCTEIIDIVFLGTQYLTPIDNIRKKKVMDVERPYAVRYDSFHVYAARIPLINIQKLLLKRYWD